MDALSRVLEVVGYKLPDIELKLDEPMKNHTSFRIGGPVRAMFFPACTSELIELAGLCREFGIAPLVMGNGTNILAGDKHHDIAVVNVSRLGETNGTAEEEISAGCGARLAVLAEIACDRGLSGFEFAHGIPGSLGGAITMNAGAYGGEMEQVVHRTKAYNHITGVFTVTGGEHGFAYRRSRFSSSGDIVIESTIRLQKGDKKEIRARMDELIVRRRESQPLDVPSAGSTFKRPKDGYAAPLIEHAGLKVFSVGGAQVSEKHSGFVVNRGGASFSDVMSVIDHVQETVLKQFGIELELEVKVIV